MALFGVLASLAGCAAPPPPPTVVNVTLVTTADVNATPDKRGAPIVLRLYQLGSAAGFNGAEFFALYGKDTATLGPDLMKREDFELAPGQTKSSTINPTDLVKSLGIFGGYRDFSHTIWRGSVDIPLHKTTNVTVTAGLAGLTVKAETVGPPPPPGKPGS